MTKIYKVKFNKRYLKDLEKIPKRDRKHLRTAILSLGQNPRMRGSKKLTGCKDPLYRIRCGQYRIIYTIRDDELVVVIIQIGHRKEIYR